MLVEFELIERARSGDDGAFNQVVQVYRKRILGTIARLIGRPEDVEDVGQEVFLRLYIALRKGEEMRSPRGWIFRVAHNLGLKIRARQDSELPFDPDLDARYAATGPNPEQQLAERERMLRFHRAVEGLSGQQRRCLFLRLEGLRYPEIGSAMGISPSAVGEFLRRAIERLRLVRDE